MPEGCETTSAKCSRTRLPRSAAFTAALPEECVLKCLKQHPAIGAAGVGKEWNGSLLAAVPHNEATVHELYRDAETQGAQPIITLRRSSVKACRNAS